LQASNPTVVLIDEVDKAPRDFPNDLLNELDNRALQVEEAEGYPPISGTGQPRLVVITSNAEHDLPEAFLRRCVFVRIPFPSLERLQRIVVQRAGSATGLPAAATVRFSELRDKLPEAQWRKIPSIGELLRWIDVLTTAEVSEDRVRSAALDELYPGTLVKSLEDARALGLRF
jgi:MoxR-like ATPase